MKQVSHSNWKEWVRFAQNDLGIATREMDRECNPRHRAYEAILAHCQQSAEKMLKAYVIKNNPSITPKVFSHDLEAIRIECANIDKSFNSPRLIKHITFLSAFVTVRYPDFWFSIDASHASRGINSATRINDFILKRLGLAE